MAKYGGLDDGPRYTTPPLARFFHQLPHLNISLHLVNSTFAPDSEIYLEVGLEIIRKLTLRVDTHGEEVISKVGEVLTVVRGRIGEVEVTFRSGRWLHGKSTLLHTTGARRTQTMEAEWLARISICLTSRFTSSSLVCSPGSFQISFSVFRRTSCFLISSTDFRS